MIKTVTASHAKVFFFYSNFDSLLLLNFLVSEMIAFLSSCDIHWMISFFHLFHHSWPQWHSKNDHCKIIFIFNMISTACWLDLSWSNLFYFSFFVKLNDFYLTQTGIFASPNGQWWIIIIIIDSCHMRCASIVVFPILDFNRNSFKLVENQHRISVSVGVCWIPSCCTCAT